jgi:hypothetical protein
MPTKSNSITGRLVVFLLCAGIAIGAISYAYSLAERVMQQLEEKKKAEQWQELRRAVVLAGTPLVGSPQTDARDYNEQASRLTAIRDGGNLELKNPELIKAWGQIEAAAEHGLLILRRIGEIDSNKPSGYEIVAKYATSDENSSGDFWKALGERLSREADKSQLEEEFRQTELNLNSAAEQLREIANGLSRKDLPGRISVEYTPSWQGTFWGDTVEIRNTSDETLEQAILFVTVHMKSGASKVHVHYANEWPSGGTLKALYPYTSTDYANAQTGDDPESVEAVLYLPSGRATTSYFISPEKWDDKVRAYCSSLGFSGNYLASYVDDSGQRFPAGFQFQFQGVPTLPVKSVEVRFTSATGTIQSAVGTYDQSTRLKSDLMSSFRSPQLDGDQPSHIDFVLSFRGTNYQHQLHVY